MDKLFNTSGQNPCMNWDSPDLPTAFKKFREHAEFMFNGPLEKKSEEAKCNYLMIWAGEKGREIFSTWSVTADEKKLLKTYWENFETYCKPKSNTIYCRYKLRSRVQKENEPFEAFVTDLKILIKDCAYPAEINDDIVRDHIVFGVNSSKIREKLINEGSDLTLQKCIDIARTYELSKSQVQEIDGKPQQAAAAADVHVVRGRGRKNKLSYRRNRDHKTGPGASHSRTAPQSTICGQCGNTHSQGKCPAKGAKCHKCGRINHFSKMCRTKNIHSISQDQQNSDSDDSQDFFVYTVNNSIDFNSRSDQAFVKIFINCISQEIDCKVDTGSQVNILPYRVFKQLRMKHPLLPPDNVLTSYTGDKLSVLGKTKIQVSYNGQSVSSDFYVVETDSPPLLSLHTSLDLGLIRFTFAVDNQANSGLDKTQVLSEYKDLFQGIGLLPGTCTLHLKENAVPVVNPPRKVPVAIQGRLKKELDSMEAKQIIAKVSEPTDWVNSLVCVEKPGSQKLRVCLDPKALNDNICRPHYPMRTIDDVTSKLTDAKYFSVLDSTKGYWSIKLDKSSSLITTFNTPFGRYRYLRLPMGIRSSQDIFQRKVDEALEGLDGVVSIVDDILVFGRTKAEHDQNLRQFLIRARDFGFRFNPDKCIIGAQEVNYFGHVISADGLKPDPQKVSSILDMKVPDNRSELETLLGMVTYLTKFAPNLAEITSPLRDLLKKDVVFRWDSVQTDALNKVKSVITQAPVLSYFDPTKPVTLQVDASSKGLGAACLQDGKPIAYASKTLTKTEQGYAQIEKEMLAIVFACNRFKHYVYGRHTFVESDHKPLEAIMKKPLCCAPPRLQRMLLQLQHFDIKVTHKRGNQIPLGDALSRNFVSSTFPDLVDGLDVHVHTVLKTLSVSDQKIEQLQNATRADKQMQTLRTTILHGWPDNRQNCPKNILEYWNHRDEMSCENDIIFKGQKLVIPVQMRQEMLTAVHVGHMGTDKTVRRARDIMFWPGMTKEITDHVLACTICARHRPSNAKEPLQPHEVPLRPWQNLSCDLFTWDGQEFLVLVDAYSRYFEIDLLQNTKSTTVIRKLKVHFSRFGIPEKIKTDNGPQFTSQEFQSFVKQMSVKHETSSPLHPSSNGLSEVYVKIAKRILQKAKEEGRDPYLPLLEYRNTTLKCGYSPAQLLMGRRLRSIIPCTNKQLQPKIVNTKHARTRMQELQARSKFHYDRHAKSLKTLKTGESVYVQKDKIWHPGKIISQHNDHSFNVKTADGGIYRRNRKYLNKASLEKCQTSTKEAPELNIKSSEKPPQNEPLKVTINDSQPNCVETKTTPIVVTRSGRVVKQSRLYSGDEWTR